MKCRKNGNKIWKEEPSTMSVISNRIARSSLAVSLPFLPSSFFLFYILFLFHRTNITFLSFLLAIFQLNSFWTTQLVLVYVSYFSRIHLPSYTSSFSILLLFRTNIKTTLFLPSLLYKTCPTTKYDDFYKSLSIFLSLVHGL